MKIQVVMTALFASLLLMVLVLYVHKQNETRKLFAATQQIEKQKMEIMAEWNRLQIEKSTLVANNRIEQVAREQLNMKLPQDEQILVISR